MNILGIVAEYNPLHNGHAYHLKMARERAQADAVIVCMTPCVTQRGTFACLPADTRVRMALSYGADAVIALPALYAVRSAEEYAQAAVSLLAGVGCNALAFGAECPDLSLLRRVSTWMVESRELYRDEIRTAMQNGQSYAEASSMVADRLISGAGNLLHQPNNILAVAYLSAIDRLGVHMIPYPIQRTGDYHDHTADPFQPSASAVREGIISGNWSAVQSCLPEKSYHLLEQDAHAGHLLDEKAQDFLLISTLKRMTMSQWKSLPEISEGIEDRMRKLAESATSYPGFIEQCTTRRYPASRFRRLSMQALLGTTQQQLLAEPLPKTALLLGCASSSFTVFHDEKNSGIPIEGNAAKIHDAWVRIEQTAWALHGLCCHKSQLLFRHHVLHSQASFSE